MDDFITYPTDRASLERDCDVAFLKGGGPGGQHRNTRETGVRLLHRPSGLVVMATERRSQPQNLDAAFERMAALLTERNHRDPARIPTRVPRSVLRRRAQAKRHLSVIKRLRRRPPDEN